MHWCLLVDGLACMCSHAGVRMSVRGEAGPGRWHLSQEQPAVVAAATAVCPAPAQLECQE